MGFISVFVFVVVLDGVFDFFRVGLIFSILLVVVFYFVRDFGF